jgi:succinate-semialdehyde dehydrogenase / glutarate-semialdehyde dehydrogenase
MMYPEVLLHIGGRWRKGERGETSPVLNPVTAEPIGHVPSATRGDLDEALEAAEKGQRLWARTPSFERYQILRKAASLLRERADTIATILTIEQGKPLTEARQEPMASADVLDWFGEEGRRAYGRVIPARGERIVQIVVKEPVGPVAAFTPWNFPVAQAAKKIAPALAAGCAIIIKGPEETPASCMELVRAFCDAGVPEGVLNLVFGVPADISEYLIPHPVIRKISFTGSTVVGKHLAGLAGRHMKRATMELGGHSVAVIFEDADVERAVSILSGGKFRNAGQICSAPSRFLVHHKNYDAFVSKFVDAAKSIKVGDGLAPDTQMGPLANVRRVEAMERFVADAVAQGAKVEAGGHRIGNQGYFFEPTVLTEVPTQAAVMNEEPFGPVAPIARFSDYASLITETNRLAYGLAAYAYTRSVRTAAAFSADCESGMVSINHHGLALPETPFGGVKDSGYGFEGGTEGLEAYLASKFVTQANL